jgi:hypothetical protein
VRLPKLFKWEEGDFGDTEADVLRFLQPYYAETAPEFNSIRSFLHGGKFSIKWKKYDWDQLCISAKLPENWTKKH